MHFRGRVETVAGNYAAYYDNIYDVMRNRAELEVPPEQAINVIHLIEAALESSRIGQCVEMG